MNAFPPPMPAPPPAPFSQPSSSKPSSSPPSRWRWPLAMVVGVTSAIASFMVFRPSDGPPVVHTPDPAVQTVPDTRADGGPPVLTPEDLQPDATVGT